MHRKIFALSIVAVILISSCSPAPSATPTAQQTQPIPSPTSIPQTYTDLDDLFEARLESGAWTEGEGLVSMLQLVAGETGGEEFQGGAEITSQAGTGILRRAQTFLQSSADENAKAEIQRLLSALVPSIEALNLYSAPAQSRSRSPGHAAQVDCRTFQREGFPFDTATECFLRYETVIEGGTVNIYFPAGWGDDERQRQYIEATQAAITDSIRAYDGLGLTHRTLYFFFTLLDYRSSSGRLVYASSDLRTPLDPSTNCMVAVSPMGAGVATNPERGFEVYKQILAHEIFHCYQFWNYNSKINGPPAEENDWWVEGTAEYFSNFVYGSVNAEYEYLGRAGGFTGFDNRSPVFSIIDMDYENFLFFQYVANELGNAGVLSIIEAMPEAAGGQADTLSAFPDIEELFHNFGRAYLDQQIMDTGGGMVPVNPRLGGIQFDVNFFDTFSVDRFIVHRVKLTFPEERHFDIEVGEEGEGSQGVRIGGPGTWEPFASVEFDVSCGNKEMVLLTTTTDPNPYSLSLNVLVTPGPDCDECLLGLWQLDNDSYSAYWNATPASEAEGVEFGGVSGLMWETYAADGMVINGWTDFTINYRQSFGGTPPDMDFAIILNGTGRAKFQVFGDTLSYSDSVSDFAITVNMNGSRVGSTGITPDALGGGITTGPYQYVCTDETLQFISAEYPQLNELIYLRAE